MQRAGSIFHRRLPDNAEVLQMRLDTIVRAAGDRDFHVVVMGVDRTFDRLRQCGGIVIGETGRRDCRSGGDIARARRRIAGIEIRQRHADGDFQLLQHGRKARFTSGMRAKGMPGTSNPWLVVRCTVPLPNSSAIRCTSANSRAGKCPPGTRTRKQVVARSEVTRYALRVSALVLISSMSNPPYSGSIRVVDHVDHIDLTDACLSASRLINPAIALPSTGTPGHPGRHSGH